MFAETTPRVDAIRAKLTEAIRQRRRIEKRIEALSCDKLFRVAISSFESQKEHAEQQAKERLREHAEKCEADRVNLARLRQERDSHPVARELQTVRLELSRLETQIARAAIDENIDLAALEAEISDESEVQEHSEI